MGSRLVVEKQLSYSGFDLSWIKQPNKQDQNENAWNTICDAIPNDDIVFSVCYGKYFGYDAVLVATNHQILFVSVTEKSELKIEYASYFEIEKIKLKTLENGNYFLNITTHQNRNIGLDVSVPFMAVHFRYAVVREVENVKQNRKTIQNDYNIITKQHFDQHHKQLDEIVSDIGFEPQNSDEWPVKQTFRDNFKKLRDVYHVKRLLTGLLITWSVIMGFIFFLTYWRFAFYVKKPDETSPFLVLTPIVAEGIILIFGAGVLGCIVYFYVYQKHLKNKIINWLCYILMFSLSAVIIVDFFVFTVIGVAANKIYLGPSETTKDVKIWKSFLTKLTLSCGIITIFFSFVVLANLIVLNVGIYQKNKVK